MNIDNLSKDQLLTLQAALQELERRDGLNNIDNYYPDEGPLRRELYVKHLEFFRAGLSYRERCMIAANRVGKSEGVGAYEVALHATGMYPDWWEGRTFYEQPPLIWCAGDTSKTVRDIIQKKLLGPPEMHGTGMLRGDYILDTSAKHGLADAVETIKVRHEPTGRSSVITLKSYDQRRESFQGTEQDVIWLDEEPPEDIYTECLMRTMTTNGIIICTFTPLMGISNVVLSFMPQLGHDSKKDELNLEQE